MSQIFKNELSNETTIIVISLHIYVYIYPYIPIIFIKILQPENTKYALETQIQN